jgi:hypothetical protein
VLCDSAETLKQVNRVLKQDPEDITWICEGEMVGWFRWKFSNDSNQWKALQDVTMNLQVV